MDSVEANYQQLASTETCRAAFAGLAINGPLPRGDGHRLVSYSGNRGNSTAEPIRANQCTATPSPIDQRNYRIESTSRN